MSAGAGKRRKLAVGIRGEGSNRGGRKAPPIVLLHAFPLDSRMWEPLVAELADAGLEAYGFDLPGFGASPLWPETEPSIDVVADAAVATLEEIGVSEAHWVGCSMGGYVALAIAERHLGTVAGLGLIDTKSTADSEAKREARLALAEEAELGLVPDPRATAEVLVGLEGDAREPVVERVTAIMDPIEPFAFAWGQRAMALRPDRTRVLESHEGPSIVVWGDRDAVSDLDEAKEMADALGVAVRRVPGAGHLSPIEEPSAVAEVLASLAG